MTALAVAARLARREATRRPWRSLLVLLLVMLPVVALTVITVVVRTEPQTWTEHWADRTGAEDFQVDVEAAAADSRPDPAVDRLLALVPDGSEIEEFGMVADRIRTVDRDRTWGYIVDRPLDVPISEGVVQNLDGRLPITSDEVLVNRRLAADLGVGLGDELVLDRPADYRGTVVGVADWTRRLNHSVMAIGTADDPDALASTFGPHIRRTIVQLPDGTTPGPELLEQVGAIGESRWVDGWTMSGSTQTSIVWTWIGGATIFIILGVVISAAFAVTARRQLSLIGQLMANGADPATLRRTLVLQGTLLGLAGAVLGVAVGLIALHVLQPLFEQYVFGRRIDGFDTRTADLVPIVVIAVAAATGSALLPARSAIRTTALSALAGRRPVGPYPSVLVARGAVAAVGGVLLLAVATAGTVGGELGDGAINLMAFTGVVGAIALVLGTCAMTPAIIARLEPIARSMRGTTRLAARSIARQRTRTGAVVAAIAVVAAGAVAGTSAWLTSEARDAELNRSTNPEDLVLITYQEFEISEDDDWIPEPTATPRELVDEVLRVVPDGTVVTTSVAHRTDTDGGSDMLQVVDDDLADLLGFGGPVRDAIDEGKMVVFGWWDGTEPPDGPYDRTSPLLGPDGDEIGSITQRVFLQADAPPLFEGTRFVSADTAATLGYEVGPGSTIVQSPAPLSGDQRDDLIDLDSDLSYDYALDAWEPGSRGVQVYLTYPYWTFELSNTVLTAGIVGGTSLLVLAVVALGLALSAAETRDERDVLATVGAPPRALRRLAAAKAGVLASTGILVGIPLGFIPVSVMVRAATSSNYTSYGAVFPWFQVGLLVVVVPLVAAAVTLVASGLALRLRPVTASTMAFD